MSDNSEAGGSGNQEKQEKVGKAFLACILYITCYGPNPPGSGPYQSLRFLLLHTYWQNIQALIQ